MRRIVQPLLLPLLAAGLAAEDKPKPEAETEAAYAWRQAEAPDVPAVVKTALIGESEKLAGEGEIAGFTYAQTPFDVKEQRFRATFRVGDKAYVLTCKPDGTDLRNESGGPAAAGGAK